MIDLFHIGTLYKQKTDLLMSSLLKVTNLYQIATL